MAVRSRLTKEGRGGMPVEENFGGRHTDGGVAQGRGRQLRSKMGRRRALEEPGSGGAFAGGRRLGENPWRRKR
jgi:hypothetical protein